MGLFKRRQLDFQRLVKLTTATSKWGPGTKKSSDEMMKKTMTLDEESMCDGRLGEGGHRKATAISFENPAFEDRASDDRFGSLKFINMAQD